MYVTPYALSQGLRARQDLPTQAGALSHCRHWPCSPALPAGWWLPGKHCHGKTRKKQLTGHVTSARTHPQVPINCMAAFPATALPSLGTPVVVPSPAVLAGRGWHCLCGLQAGAETAAPSLMFFTLAFK